MKSTFPTIYLIPGQGADERLFHHLSWPQGCKVVSLNWIEPHQNEKIEDYALRMASRIDAGIPFILIGVSLGGIMSSEIAKHIKPEKIIIISSIKNKFERPFYFKLGILSPGSFPAGLKNKFLFNFLFRNFLGNLPANDMEICHKMLLATSKYFMKWSKKAIINWNNDVTHPNLTHIHGTKDLTFPEMFIGEHIPIKGGRHIMVLNKAGEISNILNKLIFNA